MKKLFFFTLIALCLCACTKTKTPENLVGEWKYSGVKYHFDNTPLDMELDPNCSEPSYRLWLWEDDGDLPTETVVGSDSFEDIIINEDGTAIFNNRTSKVNYSNGILTLNSGRGEPKPFIVEGDSFRLEHAVFENLLGYTLVEGGGRKGYDGKATHVLKEVHTWIKK